MLRGKPSHPLSILAFSAFFIALPAHAAGTGVLTAIVSPECNNCPAAWGCVLQTLQHLMNDAIVLGVVLITIYIAWAGIAYLMAPVNAELKTAARARITNAVLGLLVMLTAWLLVDSIMKVIYNDKDFGPWNSILQPGNAALCITATTPSSTPPAQKPPATPPASAPPSGACGASSGLNCAAAVSYLVGHAHPLNKYGNQCAKFVRNALAAGGLAQFNSGQGDAYQYGPALAKAKFTVVYSGTYSASSASAFQYQEGDVAVFQPVPGHVYGHITMYTGSQWVSDAIQSNMASNQAAYQGGSFTIYRP